MQLPLYWIDAFTDRVFSGNPAAVVPLERWLASAAMQRIAFENGLSETAFFVRSGPDRFHLRWFTPAVEVDLCGHATLAAAHVIFSEFAPAGDTITFDSRSGPLVVRRRPNELLELDFPAQPPSSAPGETTALVKALGHAPSRVLAHPRLWFCVYASAAEIVALRPDHRALTALTPGRLIVTAPGDDCDFVSRFFAPDAGIPEDPVTGSAHCTLVPYWAAQLGKTRLYARQVSRRGGELWCELAADRVRIAGKTVLYLQGAVSLPPDVR